VKELSANAILELGSGKGFNVAYLARTNPQVQLVGIDLTPSHLSIASRNYGKLQNLHFQLGDFHSLPFGDEEFDLIFEVEAVCHAHDPEQVFREAYRVMRPGGRFVLFDGFRSMAVKQFPPVEHWLSLARAAGFDVLDTQDLSDAILPNLERFQFLARGFYKYPALNRQLLRLLPKSLLTNSVAGLLLPFTVSAGAQRYYSIVLEKRVSSPS
jgi:SAM-dependent methyltransferase